MNKNECNKDETRQVDMNEEIKEILDRLKKLCYDDYCLEFSVDYIERKDEKLLLDYIINVQEEINELKKVFPL